MNEQRERLVQEIGTYGARCAETGELSPPQSLIDAVDACFVLPGAGLTDEERSAVAYLRNLPVLDPSIRGAVDIACAAALRAGRSEYEVSRAFVERVIGKVHLCDMDNAEIILALIQSELESMRLTEATQ